MKIRGHIAGLIALFFISAESSAIAAGADASENGGGSTVTLKEPVPSRFGEHPADEAYGAFQRGYYITARNLAEPRAQAGDASAQTLLGEIYSRGLGVKRDPIEATKWYEKAAAQGVPAAQFQIALRMLKEEPKNAELRAEATELMRQAADGGNAEAQFNFAQLTLEASPGRSGQVKAFAYFLKAAERNIPDAQFAIAQYYLNGTGDTKVNLNLARDWLEKAANRNFDTAQLDLGNMLISGVGGDQDMEKGFSWIKRAASGGNVAAQATLAKLYWGGIGVEPDSVLAAAWFVLARREGYRDRVLEDFWEGISAETQKAAIERANRLL